MSKKIVLPGFVLLLAMAMGNVALADDEALFGVRGAVGAIGDPADLITIDAVTGEVARVIGELPGLIGVGGFAICDDEVAYAAGGGNGTPGLHAVNLRTGRTKFLGGGFTASDMTCGDDDTLYAVIAANSADCEWRDLAVIHTGDDDDDSEGGGVRVECIGPLPFVSGAGLAYDDGIDTLYYHGFEFLYTIHPETAEVLSEVPLSSILWNSLAVDEAGNLYSHFATGPDLLLSIVANVDPQTGVVTPLQAIIPPFGDFSALSALDFGEADDDDD